MGRAAFHWQPLWWMRAWKEPSRAPRGGVVRPLAAGAELSEAPEEKHHAERPAERPSRCAPQDVLALAAQVPLTVVTPQALYEMSERRYDLRW
jgi:hypothetical protein